MRSARVVYARIGSHARVGSHTRVSRAEALLERYTLARVTLDKGGMGAAALGGAKRHLVEQGWTAFLVRVSNPSSLTQAFEIYSGSAMPARMFPQASKIAAEQKAYLADTVRKEALIERMWLMSQIEASPVLSGNVVEYKIATIYSRDRGRKTGRLGFGAGILQDNPSWGAVSRASVANPLVTDFVSQPSRDIQLQILDDDGVGCMASLMIHDANKHIYPPQVMRLAPDLAFQPHIYRADGETVRLPDGEYHIMVRRALLQTWGTAARRHPVGGLGSIGEMLIEHNHGFGQGRGSNSECSFNQAHLPHDTWLQAPCLGLSFA